MANLFSEATILRATDITSQALYYLPPGTLEHVFVVAGERSRRPDDERAEATRALREMLSAGQLTKVVTTSQKGRFESETIHQKGPIAYIESTTQPTIFDEDSNRCLLLGTDESSEQTRAIMQAAARAAMGRSSDISGVIARHHALQLMLRPAQVQIPFAVKLEEAFPSSNPNARRAFPHVLNVIRAVALLHPQQRGEEHVGDVRIIKAAIDDYVVARRLLLGPLARALGGALSPVVTNFGKRLADRHASNVFTSTQALRGDDILTSRGKINEYLKALGDAGVLELVEPGKGNQPARWQVVHVVPEAGAVWLPEVAAMTDQNTPSPPVCV